MSKLVELTTPEEDAWALRKEEKRRRKEAKEQERAAVSAPDDDNGDAKPAKKRKREALPEEIEVDVNLPEPTSKKEARKAKKIKSKPETSADDAETSTNTKSKTEPKGEEKKGAQRSAHGVWIGNLPWSATKDSLRKFLIENSDIADEQITRVNLPAPTKPPNPTWTTKPLNKGFAYVDFSTELAMYSAIALTETKMDGRALLIKNAKSFEGRPDKPRTEFPEESKDATGKKGNPPNKRVFVGNLAFDVTKEDLQEHYGQCGEIAMLHMATFEDSGKCKGYAWVTFETVEAATSAVKGFFIKEVAKKNASDSEGENGAPKKTMKRKWLVSKLMGRDLRCEFAEDSTIRYNKRYGKEKPAGMEGVHPDRVKRLDEDDGQQRPRPQKQFREKRPERKVDPRTIKSGAAHTNAQRAPHGIVKSEGKKITFD
jgi:RNA recognition motif-containing protein